jgi:AcrR family transcriptional regulator
MASRGRAGSGAQVVVAAPSAVDEVPPAPQPQLQTQPQPQTQPQRRGPGRPRSARRSALVLAATLDEIVATGIGALTIEAVATRAGVSKATVYRRWPDKIALVLAALETLPELPAPDTGSLVDDLCALRGELVHLVSEWHLGDVLPALMAERRRSGHGDAIRRYIDRRSEPFALAVACAVERGELRTSLPEPLVTQLFVAPLAMSVLNRDTPLDDSEWRAVIITVVQGLHA